MRTDLSRRTLMKLAVAGSAARVLHASPAVSLFDGKTLEGWIQAENNATSLSSAGILDPTAFVKKLLNGTDPMSVFLKGHLLEQTRTDLATWSPDSANSKTVISALVKDINRIIDGPGIPVGAKRASPEVESRARVNKLLLEDAYPAELAKSLTTGWVVKDGAMASTGVGRGVIYTAKDYGRFRLAFTMRHVSGDPDHQACVLIFCTRPQPGQKPLDALAGIQFQVPNGGRWDYRPGKNNNGGDEFTLLTKTKMDPRQWSRVEILADATQGTAHMTVAQPVGATAIDVLEFKDPTAGKSGPIAWQMHNAGLFDEYKDVTIEV